MRPLRVGTRKSPLALYQARQVGTLLAAVGFECQLVEMETSGDRFLNGPLSAAGGKGLFLKELEQALLADEIDMAVHSLKDVPAVLAPEFCLPVFLPRDEFRDAWISSTAAHPGELPGGSLIGTSSPRRIEQLKLLNSNLSFVPIRGNIQTRLEKMEKENLSGIVLSNAGLVRMGLSTRATHLFEPEEMIPAPGQGTIVIEMKTDDPLQQRVRKFSHPETEECCSMEREVQQHIGGDCFLPFGCLVRKSVGQKYRVDLFLKKDDNTIIERKVLDRRGFSDWVDAIPGIV